jgi:RNA-directed DNA polymerase
MKSRTLSDGQILKRLGIPRAELEELASTLDDHYEERQITDGKKNRLLLVPTPALKRIQKRIERRLLRDLPVDPAAFCHRGRGIVAAARLHVRHPYLLRLDFADFFPNTSIDAVRDAFLGSGLSSGLSRLLSELVCFRGQLPQGAPTSVAVSNLVMRSLDKRIGSLCRSQGLTYTRYVDDLAISGGRRVTWIEPIVRRIIGEAWTLNEKKRELFTPDQRHTYLGIILNSHPNLDAEYVRTLARSIRRIAERYPSVPLPLQRRLIGRISYVRAVHRAKGDRLAELYVQRIGSLSLPAPERRRARKTAAVATESSAPGA